MRKCGVEREKEKESWLPALFSTVENNHITTSTFYFYTIIYIIIKAVLSIRLQKTRN